MNKYFLDTNFIYALLSEQDALHQKASKTFELIKYGQLFTSVVVIGELYSSESEVDFLNFTELAQIEIIDYKKDDLIPLFSLYKNIRTKLKANDSSILVHSLTNSLELITFDISLSKIFNTLKSQMI